MAAERAAPLQGFRVDRKGLGNGTEVHSRWAPASSEAGVVFDRYSPWTSR
jgi:hypothetical protein